MFAECPLSASLLVAPLPARCAAGDAPTARAEGACRRREPNAAGRRRIHTAPSDGNDEKDSDFFAVVDVRKVSPAYRHALILALSSLASPRPLSRGDPRASNRHVVQVVAPEGFGESQGAQVLEVRR